MTMTPSVLEFLQLHRHLTRRFLLQLGSVGAAAMVSQVLAWESSTRDPRLQAAIEQLETWLTASDKFRDVSRGKPIPHTLSESALEEAGLTRATWKLEVLSDTEHPTRVRSPLTKADNTALDFDGLLRMSKRHAVRFAKVMTCLNIGCPLGCGVWEGVPLRDVLWLTQPVEDWRRVFYYGFHNHDPAQVFRSSLPVGRVLEDPPDWPPVILCYKLNGEWLSPERGGPVRMVVPEAYGFKSVKWLTTVVLTNLAHANDTYADGNNDIDSPLKTFAATLSVPQQVAPHEPFAVTGYAQVGVGGLSKVQVWLHDDAQELPSGDPHFTAAPWMNAEIISPPTSWGGNIAGNTIPADTLGFDQATNRPLHWPMRLTKVHWAALIPGLPFGEYTLRCRTVDKQGHGQPMPRPFRKSGHAAIEQVSIRVATS